MPGADRGGPRDVVIAGAGSAGELLCDCMDGDDRWNVVAFLDEGKAGAHRMKTRLDPIATDRP